MSVGDRISVLNSVVANAYLTYQPAAGVEAIILNAGIDVTFISGDRAQPEADFHLYNGVLFCYLAILNGPMEWWTDWRIYVNNTVYVRINNLSGAVAICHIQGLQTK